MADYFSQTDLENALSVNVVMGAYDDDHDGVVDSGPIAACIAYGGSECDSFLRNLFLGSVTLPLETVPNEVKFAALDFGIAYTVRRRPDVVKAMNEQPWTVFYDAALAKMKRYCESIQRMPATVGTHATAGATVLVPESDVDDDDEPDQESRWADLADFS
jgi:hypothetical protein